jgi:hypothetical protein
VARALLYSGDMKLILASLLLAACSSSSAVTLGSTQAGPYTFDVKYEGPAPAAGVMTNFVLKPTAGGMPTSIESWVGPSDVDASMKEAGVYDPADGDYDTEIAIPNPLPSGAKYYFDVNTNGTVVTGSMDL